MSPAIDEPRFSTQVEPQLAGDDDVGKTAAVNGSAAVAFMKGVTAQMKEDVLYSTLLAQMEADRAFPGRPMDKRKEWYHNFRDVLQSLGWIIYTFRETDLDDAREYDTPGNVALQLAMPDFEILEYVVLSGLLGALQDMVNSDSYEVFNKMAMHGDDASFQLGVVSNVEGDALLKCSAHQYNAKMITLPLTYQFDPASEVAYLTINMVMQLKADIYAGFRQMVRDRVEEAVKDVIREVEMS